MHRLTQQLSVGGFEGPSWSARVSHADLRDERYDQIARSLPPIAGQYLDERRTRQDGA